MAHTIARTDSYFPSFVLDESYAKGNALLNREDMMLAKWPVGMKFMSRSNVRQLMRTLRERSQDCTLQLSDMHRDLKTTYYRYFATMNEPVLPPEEVGRVVRIMNAAVLEKLVQSRTLYTKARRAFLQAIGGMNPVERRPIWARTTDTTVYAAPPNLAPCFTNPQDCVYGDTKGRAPGFVPRSYPPEGGAKLFQPRPNWRGKRRTRLD